MERPEAVAVKRKKVPAMTKEKTASKKTKTADPVQPDVHPVASTSAVTTGSAGVTGNSVVRSRNVKGSNLKIHHAYVRASLFKDYNLINPIPLDNGGWKIEVAFKNHKVTPIVDNKEDMIKVCKKVLEYQKKYGIKEEMHEERLDRGHKSDDDARSDPDLSLEEDEEDLAPRYH